MSSSSEAGESTAFIKDPDQQVENINSTNYDGVSELAKHSTRNRKWTSRITCHFKSVFSFTLFCGLSHFFFGMATSIMSGQIVAFERQFGLDSSLSGLMKTASSIGMLATCMFSVHLARTVNIPKTVGITGIITGIAMTIPGFLHFIQPYHPEDDDMVAFNNQTNSTIVYDRFTCNAINNNETGHANQRDRSHFAYHVIMICMVIKGMMVPFRFGTLPMIFIDNNIVDKPRVGIYMAMLTVSSELVGPLGEIFNGFISNVPVNLDDSELTIEDPRFVSAWWLGFLIFGACTLLSSVPLMFMPRRIISRQKQNEALRMASLTFSHTKVKLMDDNNEQMGDNVGKNNLKENQDGSKEHSFLSMLMFCKRWQKTSLANKPKKIIASDSGKEIRVASPPMIPETEMADRTSKTELVVSPLPKTKRTKRSFIKEIKVSLREFPVSVRRIFINALWVLLFIEMTLLAVPWAGLSAYGVKYVIFEYHATQSIANYARGLSTSITDIIGVVLSTVVCSRLKTRRSYLYFISIMIFIGACLLPLQFIFKCENNTIYGKSGHLGAMVLNKSRSCNCEDTEPLLSCGDDGRSYLSPCHAGCDVKNGTAYTDCVNLATFENGDSLTTDVCNPICLTQFIIYNVILSVQGFLYFLTYTPRRLLAIRITHPDDRAMASAFIFVSYSSVSIPAPLIVGRLFDTACEIWTGQCAYYDRERLQYIFVGTDIVTNMIAVVTYVLMILVCLYQDSKRKGDWDRNKTELEERDMKTVTYDY